MAGLLDMYFPAEDPMNPANLLPQGLLGPSVLSRMQQASDAQRGRWQAGERGPTPLNEENMWLADDVAGGLLGPMAMAGIFAGVGAKTANKAALETAQRMASEGADPRAIWRDTGWFQGPEGKWRWEIDDSGSRLTNVRRTPQEAYDDFRQDAFINDDALSREIADSIKPFLGKSGEDVLAEAKAYRQRGFDLLESGRKDAAKEHFIGSPYSTVESAITRRDYGPMDRFMTHGSLSASYPDLAGIHTRLDDSIEMDGVYYPGSRDMGEQVVLRGTPFTDADRSLLLHELQHGVQQREGFARGGLPSQFGRGEQAQTTRSALHWRREVDAKLAEMPGADRLAAENALIDEYRHLDAMDMVPSVEARDLANQPQFSDPEYIERAWRALHEYGLDRRVNPYTPREAYRRLAGEAEARAVQKRMDMTPEQRRATFPLDSYDVPLDELIVRRP